MVKGISLNVGSSSQNVNGRGVIYPNLTFQYIPIPETEPVKSKIPTYAEYAELNLKKVKLKNPNALVHLDPEFRTYTYGHFKRGFGDMSRKNGLLNLNEGDYLFFHATLSHPSKPSLWLTAIIGYFIIESVIACRHLTKEEIEEQYIERFRSNAHLKQVDPNVDLLISGSKKSKLFQYAIPLSNFSTPSCLNEKFKGNICTVTGKQIDSGKPWHRWTLKVNDSEGLIEGRKNLRKNFFL